MPGKRTRPNDRRHSNRCAYCGCAFMAYSRDTECCTKSCARRLANGTLSSRLWAQVEKTETCWLGSGRNGRHWKLRRGEFRDGEIYAHVAAWEEASGQPVPDDMMICHTCDVGSCIRNDDSGVYVVNGVEYPRRGHLWLGTDAANSADKVAKGRQAKGEGTGVAKMTPDLVRAFRARLAEVGNRSQVALEFGIGRTTAYKIDHRVTWSHVE